MKYLVGIDNGGTFSKAAIDVYKRQGTGEGNLTSGTDMGSAFVLQTRKKDKTPPG